MRYVPTRLAGTGASCEGQSFAGGKPAPQIHLKRQLAYTNLDPKPIPVAERPEVATGIVHGDCLKVMAEMPDGSVDLVITSPPYNALNTPGGGWWDSNGKYFRRRSDRPGRRRLLSTTPTTDAMPVAGVHQMADSDCLREMMLGGPDRGRRDLSTCTGGAFRMTSWKITRGRYSKVAPQSSDSGVRQIITWARNPAASTTTRVTCCRAQEQIYLAGQGRRAAFDTNALGVASPTWLYLPPDGQARPGANLPPQFPVEIPRTGAGMRFSPNSSSAASAHGLVLDPFGGSGTVAAAAVAGGLGLRAHRHQRGLLRLRQGKGGLWRPLPKWGNIVGNQKVDPPVDSPSAAVDHSHF